MNVEQFLAKADELHDGEMKEIQLGEITVLLVRVDGEFHAYWPSCPHHGAPLAEGLLHDGHIRCPWHQSVFDARSGELIEPPSLDLLPHFEVRSDGQNVYAQIPADLTELRPPPMAHHNPAADGRTFVIVGSGAAGVLAAETLRTIGYKGGLFVLTNDPDKPYDRTVLSKKYMGNPDKSIPLLRKGDLHAAHDIEIVHGWQLARVDHERKTVTSTDGRTMSYDRLLLATGGTPRTLDVPGQDLDHVFLLRSHQDAKRIRWVAGESKTAVVVGSSFIGMEVAASLTHRGLKVHVVAPESEPFASSLGPDVGAMLRSVHADQGVTFHLGHTVAHFEGPGRLRTVVLDSGERIDAGLAVIGVGVRPATDYETGLERRGDGSFVVDSHLRAAEDVYVAGDIASFPDWRTGEPLRIEHWRVAQQLGRVAAFNMADRPTEYLGVPFFWTNQYKLNVQYVGHARDWDDFVVEGSIDDQEFVGWYVKDGRVRAAAGSGCDRKMGAAAEVLNDRELYDLDTVRERVERILSAVTV